MEADTNINKYKRILYYDDLGKKQCTFLIFRLSFLSDGSNMTSNNNASHEDAINGQLRLDCSSAAGAPTLTTPTLTPTTLRNIEQMFLEASDQNLEHPIVHQNAAHFVPPPVAMESTSSTSASTSSIAPIPGPTSITIPLPGPSALSLVVPEVPLPGPPPPDPGPSTAETSALTRSQSPLVPLVKSEDAMTSTSRQNNNNNVIEAAEAPPVGFLEGLNDEDRRKQLRRLRNKEAAARCRKRRMDQTLSLQGEVDRLEEVKRELRGEVQSLQREMDKLKGILELHQCSHDEQVKRSRTAES